MTDDRLSRLEHRQDELEQAMRKLQQDWFDTLALIPTKREVEKIDDHLSRQDKLIIGGVIGFPTTVLIALIYIVGYAHH